MGFWAIAEIGQRFLTLSEGDLITNLFVWGPGGEAYVTMLVAINLVLGVALYKSASNLKYYAPVIDLWLIINSAHIIVMFLLSLSDEHSMMHLMGVVPIGIFAIIVVSYYWLPYRRALIIDNLKLSS